jgi:Domain of unknown function (DUF4426)
MTRRMTALAILVFGIPVAADQFKTFGDIEVHYVVVNTLFLDSDVAAHYGVSRSSDRAIVNLSVLDHNGVALLGEVSGVTINLLSQRAPLQFSTIREGDAIYYIAPIRYTDRDVLRFDLTVSVPDRAPMKLEFQQTMYVEAPR